MKGIAKKVSTNHEPWPFHPLFIMRKPGTPGAAGIPGLKRDLAVPPEVSGGAVPQNEVGFSSSVALVDLFSFPR